MAIRSQLIPGLGLLVVLAAFFYVVSGSLADPHALPGVFPDSWEVVWTIWWLKRASIEYGLSIYYSPEVFHPFGSSTLLHALGEGVTLPLTLLFSNSPPQVIYLLACLLCFALNYVFSYRLFALLGPTKCCAALLAVLFTLHPSFIGRLDGGQFVFLCFFPVLLIFESFFRLLEGELESRKQRKWQLIFALSIASLPFFNLYYLYFTTFTLLLLALLLGVRSRDSFRRLSRTVLPAALIGLSVAAVKAIPVALLAKRGSYTPDHNPAVHSADLLGYLVPSSYQVLGSSELTKGLLSAVTVNTVEAATYIGFGVLALFIFFRSRFQFSLLIGVLILILLSQGPKPELGGDRFIGLSLYSLLQLFPLSPSVPARFGVFAILLIFIGAAAGLGEVARRTPHIPLTKFILAVVALTFAVIETVPAKLQTTTYHPSPVLLQLAADSSIKAIHDTTPDLHLAIKRQVHHQKSITRAFLSRRPRKPLRVYEKNTFIKFIERGVEVEPSQLQLGWEQLQIDGVLIATEEPEQLVRAASLKWLEKKFSDSEVVYFGLLQ